jgi:hypothetical protein
MWWGQYLLLFLASILLSIGAFTGRARGFTSILGMFSWFIVGNASVAVVHFDGAGGKHVAQSEPLTWLCYGVAVVHFVALLIAIREEFVGEDDTEDAEDVAQGIDPAEIPSENFDIPGGGEKT